MELSGMRCSNMRKRLSLRLAKQLLRIIRLSSGTLCRAMSSRLRAWMGQNAWKDILRSVTKTDPAQCFTIHPGMRLPAEIIRYMKTVAAISGMQYEAKLQLNANRFMKTENQFTMARMFVPYLQKQYGTNPLRPVTVIQNPVIIRPSSRRNGRDKWSAAESEIVIRFGCLPHKTENYTALAV